jgi:hypothetical protein
MAQFYLLTQDINNLSKGKSALLFIICRTGLKLILKRQGLQIH